MILVHIIPVEMAVYCYANYSDVSVVNKKRHILKSF